MRMVRIWGAKLYHIIWNRVKGLVIDYNYGVDRHNQSQAPWISCTIHPWAQHTPPNKLQNLRRFAHVTNSDSTQLQNIVQPWLLIFWWTKMEIIGWTGSILLAFCGLPQAWQSYKQKHSHGVSWGLLILWGLGEVFTIIYILPKWYWPLLFNYISNLIFIGVIVYYKLKPGFKV